MERMILCYFISVVKINFIAMLSLIVVGCAPLNQKYKFYCEPSEPRNLCESAGYNGSSSGCAREKVIIERCSEYVRYEVEQLKRKSVSPAFETHNNKIDYEARDTPLLLVGLVEASNSSRPVYINAQSESSFIRTAAALDDLVNGKIKAYETQRKRYFHDLENGYANVDQILVMTAIQDIEKISVGLQKASELGKPFLAKVRLESADGSYADLASKVVRTVNPQDEYLKRAAAQAIAYEESVQSFRSKKNGAENTIQSVMLNIDRLIKVTQKNFRREFISEVASFKEMKKLSAEKIEEKERHRATQEQQRQKMRKSEEEKSMACKINPVLCS